MDSKKTVHEITIPTQLYEKLKMISKEDGISIDEIITIACKNLLEDYYLLKLIKKRETDIPFLSHEI